MARVLILCLVILSALPLISAFAADNAELKGDARWLGPASWEIRESLKLAGIGQGSQALEILDRVLAKDKENVQTRAARALVQALSGQLAAAVKELQSQAAEKSTVPFVQICWLRAQAMQGANPELLKQVDQVKKSQPEFPDAARLAAEIRLLAGMLDASLADCNDWLKITPQDRDAYLLKGRILQRAGKLDAAIAAVDQGLEHHAKDPGLWNQRGLLCRDNQNLSGAQRAFEKAVEYAPVDPEALTNLGEVLLTAGGEKEALGYFRQAIVANASFERAYGNCAFIALNNGQPERVKAFGEALLKAKPDTLLGRNLIGRALIELGKLDESLPWFEEILKINPDDFDALFNLGKAAGSLEKFDLALKCFARADAIRPGNQEVIIMLGFSLLQTGQTEQALPHLERGINLDPMSGLAQQASQVLGSLSR